MEGVININKPRGVTSHDVVMQVRRITGEKKIGHTGTLDPLATGVLVLCLGKATRIAQYLEAGEKEYRVIMRLGITTDTLDAEGKVTGTNAYTPPSHQAVVEASERFIGDILQQPPAFSAIKIAGVPAYKLARQGKEPVLAPRAVRIFGIQLAGYDDPFVSLTVHCSKGVYIRTLCAEIGAALGMGAHVTDLTRIRSGNFRIEDALALDELARRATEGTLSRSIISIDAALNDFPVVLVSPEEAVRVMHGNRIACPVMQGGSKAAMVRIGSRESGLLALARVVEGELRPELVFS